MPSMTREVCFGYNLHSFYGQLPQDHECRVNMSMKYKENREKIFKSRNKSNLRQHFHIYALLKEFNCCIKAVLTT